MAVSPRQIQEELVLSAPELPLPAAPAGVQQYRGRLQAAEGKNTQLLFGFSAPGGRPHTHMQLESSEIGLLVSLEAGEEGAARTSMGGWGGEGGFSPERRVDTHITFSG